MLYFFSGEWGTREIWSPKIQPPFREGDGEVLRFGRNVAREISFLNDSMVQQLRKAMNRRSERSREALLLRLEGELDGIFDLIHHMFGDETQSLSVLESVLRRSTALSKRERYERYLRLWAFGVTVDSIRRAYPRYLAERAVGEQVPFEQLSVDEKLVLFLHDRAGLSYEEISAVTQFPVGRVGRSLAYAREKVAKEVLGRRWQANYALRERQNWNRTLEGSTPYIVAMAEGAEE